MFNPTVSFGSVILGLQAPEVPISTGRVGDSRVEGVVVQFAVALTHFRSARTLNRQTLLQESSYGFIPARAHPQSPEE